jgi:hypothetical protein
MLSVSNIIVIFAIFGIMGIAPSLFTYLNNKYPSGFNTRSKELWPNGLSKQLLREEFMNCRNEMQGILSKSDKSDKDLERLVLLQAKSNMLIEAIKNDI